MGYHDLRDSSAHASVQKGSESWPLEIDSGSDIGNDFVIWKPFPQESLLPFKITFLFGRRDPGVCEICSATGIDGAGIAGNSIPSVSPAGVSMLNMTPICPVS